MDHPIERHLERMERNGDIRERCDEIIHEVMREFEGLDPDDGQHDDFKDDLRPDAEHELREAYAAALWKYGDIDRVEDEARETTEVFVRNAVEEYVKNYVHLNRHGPLNIYVHLFEGDRIISSFEIIGRRRDDESLLRVQHYAWTTDGVPELSGDVEDVPDTYFRDATKAHAFDTQEEWFDEFQQHREVA